MLLKKALSQLSSGEVLQIEVTDVHAELDFEIWCERFGHSLKKTKEKSGEMTFLVGKEAGAQTTSQ